MALDVDRNEFGCTYTLYLGSTRCNINILSALILVESVLQLECRRNIARTFIAWKLLSCIRMKYTLYSTSGRCCFDRRASKVLCFSFPASQYIFIDFLVINFKMFMSIYAPSLLLLRLREKKICPFFICVNVYARATCANKTILKCKFYVNDILK